MSKKCPTRTGGGNHVYITREYCQHCLEEPRPMTWLRVLKRTLTRLSIVSLIVVIYQLLSYFLNYR